MDVELSKAIRKNVAKSFSSCWIHQQELQFDPATKSKSDKSTWLSEDEVV